LPSISIRPKHRGSSVEQLTGYVGIVTASPTPELKTMVNDINLRRRASYQEIAAKTAGATLNAVEKTCGREAHRQDPSGQYVQNASGQWVKKP